ncbi:MAG: preprotein translocase subunit SecY [Candidatus Nitrosocosmicus sp.]
MSSIKNDGIFRTVVKKVSPFIPQVEKPKKKITLRNKLIWTGVALLIYFTMGQIELYGIITDPANDPLAFARVIFAAQQGTLIELGIGPIVTAGLLMQLLKGSDMLKLNFRDPNDRSLFTSATKIVTIIVIIAEGALYGMAVYGGSTPSPAHTGVLIAQLIGASVIVMYLDELVQKGWGLGSGISVFIMAGVAQTIVWSIFNPFPVPNFPELTGLIPGLIDSGLNGHIGDMVLRSAPPAPTPNLPSIFGLGITSGILLLLVYTQGIHIDIPIVSTRYRGFTATYPIKLLYTSNIPVILASALLANAMFVGHMLWANFNPNNDSPFFNMIAQYNGQAQTPSGGLFYYMNPPRSLDAASADPLHAVVYVLFMTIIITIFGRLWVELGGLSAKSAAKNLLDADVQVPGFRRSESSVESLLNRYIPSVTIIGGIIIGLLAGVSNVFSVFGSGIGLLLMVDILVNYYNLLVREQVDVHMPKLASLIGRD